MRSIGFIMAVVMCSVMISCDLDLDPVEIDISVNAVSVASGGSFSYPETPVDGEGGEVSSVAVTVKNVGSAPLKVSQVLLDEAGKNFLVDPSNFSVTVQAQASATFSVSFDPQSEGELSCKLRILSDDKDEGTYSITLKGNVGQVAPPAGSFSVTYFGNGASAGASPAREVFGNGATVTVAGAGTLERTGYAFSGWNTAEDGTGTLYVEGDTFTISDSVNLFAKWTVNRYTVSFNANGGTGTPPTAITQNHGTMLNVPTSGTLERYQNRFLGWSPNSSSPSASYRSTQEFVPPSVASAPSSFLLNQDVALYAVWQKMTTCYVGFDSHGGTAVSAQNVTFGGKAVKPANPSWSGPGVKSFQGWYRLPQFSTNTPSMFMFDFNAVIERDTLVHAWWNPF